MFSVCGLGYGVMGGLFGITNIIADSQGERHAQHLNKNW